MRCGSRGAMVFGTTALAMFTTSVIYHWERSAGAQAAPAQARSLRHLSTHRGHLHAVHAGGHAGRVGLVAVRRGLDAGGARHRGEDHGGLPLSAAVDRPVSRHGLAHRRRHQAAARESDRRARSAGSPRAACCTPAACRSTSGRRGATRTRCGTCSCSAASPVTSPRC